MGLLAVKSTIVETRPPAKLNLFLELLGKRPDGFHELQTVMVAIDRRDALRIARTAEPGVELVCSWSPSPEAWRRRLPMAPQQTFRLPPPEQNLVVRTLRRFLEVFGCEGGFSVTLEKRIPAGAGMGGASSDAASALLCAAALCGVESRDPRIFQLAAELGSDVPFFLIRGGGGVAGEPVSSTAAPEMPDRGNWPGMALAGGRGERLLPLSMPWACHLVVIYPPEPLSTAAVFGQCTIPADPLGAESCVDSLRGPNSTRIPQMFNRLTGPARQMSAWIDRSLAALDRVGLQGATMTGSGSACFALARSAREARRAASILSSRGLGLCFATTPTSLPAAIQRVT